MFGQRGLGPAMGGRWPCRDKLTAGSARPAEGAPFGLGR
jgi:hypothetical protein